MHDIILKEKNFIANNTLELIFKKSTDFIFTAGQYVFLQVKDAEGEMCMRAMSIASHPSEEVLKFAMRISESEFKQVCTQMVIGNSAKIIGPKGNFGLVSDNKPIVFIVGGIGITPIMSMLRELELNTFKKKVHLIYCNKTKENVAYGNEIIAIKLEHFHYDFIYTENDGHIQQQKLNHILGDLRQYQYYIVGGNSFIESMKDTIKKEGVLMKNILIDNFGG